MTETRCRSCSSHQLVPVLSLGSTPLANRLLTRDDLSKPEPRYPLDLVFCDDCTLLQITETVPPETLFRDYVYLSSVSETVVANAEDCVARVLKTKDLGRDDLVVEIASNDGYLLQFYRRAGVPVLGIEPAKNIASEAVRSGIPTRPEFFSLELSKRLAEEGNRASVIHGNNVLAHVADLNGVVDGIATLLRTDGIAVIEVPYVRDLIEHCEFDTIYHEHLCYFSVSALDELFTRHRLRLFDVERIPIHGGSIRLWIAPATSRPVRSSVGKLIEEERTLGLRDAARYKRLAEDVESLKRDLTSLLHRLRSEGSRIGAYGASAKGATLLNYFGIDSTLLDFVIDKSTAKQGRYTPGSHLPILSPDVLRDRRPEYLLLLTWNHAEEILRQQDAYRSAGGKFIIPVPRPAIV